jgi:hypothetical protein
MKRIFLLLLLAFSISTLADTTQTGMVYRYWDWGKTPKRDDYQIAALRLALEKTQNEYGVFTIIRHQEDFTTSRVRREVNRGEIVNIQAGPWRPLETEIAKLSERSLRVEIPILKGLLGYRQLIIRKSDEQLFKKIKTTEELKKLIAGQARGWQDVDIFRFNGYPVDDSANLSTLFSMLNSKRFDYFPMSIAEASSALTANPEYGQGFMIAPNMIIYYPLPIIFYVSESQPQLAERLRKGLIAAEKDGSLDKLFTQFFAEDVAQVKKQNPRCFVLKNPYIPEHLNQHKPILLEQ